MSGLEDIKKYIRILKLNDTRVPTLGELKKAYKDLYFLHPDKNNKDRGEDTTKEFQEITEAVDKVSEFILQNPQLQSRTDSLENKEAYRFFEKNNGVKYNADSVTFYTDPNTIEAWKKAFEKKLGSGTAMKDEGAIQYKKDDWCIDSVSTASKPVVGSVSICIWPNKQTILVQGKNYLAFLTFAIPGMIKSVHKLTIPLEEKNEDDSEKIELDLTLSESDVLVDSFRTLEKEVKTIRNELIDKVDGALQEITESNNKTVTHVNDKMDKLEASIVVSKKELDDIRDQLSVIVDQTKDNTSVNDEMVKLLAEEVAKASNFKNIEKAIWRSKMM